MYLTVGLCSGLVGVLTLLSLPDTPMDARFLSRPEKRTILRHVAVNGTGIHNSRFEVSQLKAVFLDPQVWLLFLSVSVTAIGAAILATYGTTMIRGFGYTSKEAALLNMPGGGITFVSVVSFAYLVRYKVLSRWWSVAISLSIALIGTCLVAFISRSNHIGQLIGLWMVSGAAVGSPWHHCGRS